MNGSDQGATVPRNVLTPARLYRMTLQQAWPAALLTALITVIYSTHVSASLPDPFADDALATCAAYLGSARFWYPTLFMLLGLLWPFGAVTATAQALSSAAPLPTLGGLAAGLRAYAGALLCALVLLLGTLVGFVLLVVPGVYWPGRLQWCFVELFARQRGPVDALRGSWVRMAGHWWLSNTRITLIVLASVIVVALIGALVDGTLALARGLWPLSGATRHGLEIASSLIGEFLVAPAYPVALVVSYREISGPGRPRALGA